MLHQLSLAHCLLDQVNDKYQGSTVYGRLADSLVPDQKTYKRSGGLVIHHHRFSLHKNEKKLDILGKTGKL